MIALALSLAPITSAWAVVSMHGGMHKAETAAAAPDDAMSDCMKAMQGEAEKNCPCCDTPSKAACPDMATCLAKCGINAVVVLSPERTGLVVVVGHDRPADPQKPPDWARRPPAPPPRT